MSKVANEFARVQLRSASANVELLPANDVNALKAMNNIVKVQDFIEPIARLSKKEGTTVRGWSYLHIPFFHALYGNICSIVLDQTLTATRGNGRLSTIVDNIYTAGYGLRARAKGISNFLELDGIEWESKTVGAGNIVAFPVLPVLYKSGDLFQTLELKLNNRVSKLEAHKSLKGQHMTRTERERFNQEKEFYLIKPTWDTGKIKQTGVEFLARAFAQAMHPDVREELVLGGPTGGLSFGRALDTLSLQSRN